MLILKPSKVHGVGVFTTKFIKKGTKLPLFNLKDYLFRKILTGFGRRYSIKDKEGWHGPKDFHRMSIGWYLNDGRDVSSNVDTYKALKNIKGGEELLIDYRLL